MVQNIGGPVPPVAGLGVNTASGPTAGSKDFANYVRDAASEAIASLHRGEDVSKEGIAGKADLTDVVAAVNDAELTLQTVTTLRDKLVSAYQEILRIPI
ncbi:flagellar hook-basal body complex protein FliE [Thalassobaculum sp.]|uniref:flagellar hook-basal body complex protein FliE n=1 Tax=Thalassobaculum sp. TaxID=2022740 RepID=UPI0032EDDE70